MPYVKTSLMTLGLAERKERRFGRGRPPNTITVAINCRKDGEERQDSHGKEWKEGGREGEGRLNAAAALLLLLVSSISHRLLRLERNQTHSHTPDRRNQEPFYFPG